MTSVWPALCPPWKRTTTSACSDSQSTILPLPSSPHWAPTTTTFATGQPSETTVTLRIKKPGARPGSGENLARSLHRSGPVRQGLNCRAGEPPALRRARLPGPRRPVKRPDLRKPAMTFRRPEAGAPVGMERLRAAQRRLFAQPYLLLTLVTLMWGGNAVASRIAIGEVSPMALVALRWVLVLILLAVFAR